MCKDGGDVGYLVWWYVEVEETMKSLDVYNYVERNMTERQR